MFKLFNKLLMLMVVLALAGPFILKRPDGQPMMSMKDLNLPAMPSSFGELWQRVIGSVGNSVPSPSGGETAVPTGASINWSNQAALPSSFVPQPGVEYPKQEGIFYRYKDAKGVWQFSDTPQPGTTNFVSSIDPKANVIQSLNKEQIDTALGRTPPEPPPDQKKEEKKDDSLLSNLPLPMTVPVAEIPNLIQQAKDVQALTNERTKQLEQNRF